MSKQDDHPKNDEERRRQVRESKRRTRARDAGSVFEFSVRLTREDMEALKNISVHSESSRTAVVCAMIRQALRRKQAYNISFEETDLVIGTPESLDQYYKKKYQESGGSSQIELMFKQEN